MQGSLDDDASAGNGVPDRSDNEPTKDDLGEGNVVDEDNAQVDSEYFDNFRQASNGRKRESAGTRVPFLNSVQDDTPDGDGISSFPPEEERCVTLLLNLHFLFDTSVISIHLLLLYDIFSHCAFCFLCEG